MLVIGFLIGTALSLFGSRINSPLAFNSPPPFPTGAPEVSALPATPSPESATARPAAKPSPRRSAKPLPAHSPVPTPTPRPTATPPPPSAAPEVTAAPGAVSAESSAEPASAAPAPAKASPERTLKPVAAASVAPIPKPSEPVTGSADYADSDFARLSAGVVRSYLGDLMRGDTDSAYAAFGAAPGDRGIIFTEQGIVDAQTQIVRVDARQTGTDAATVDVTLKSPKGHYFAQYFLKRSPTGAALITEHEMIKP